MSARESAAPAEARASYRLTPSETRACSVAAAAMLGRDEICRLRRSRVATASNRPRLARRVHAVPCDLHEEKVLSGGAGVADKVGQQAQHGGGIDSRLQDTEPSGCNGIPVAVSRLCGELTRLGQEYEAACDVGIPDAGHACMGRAGDVGRRQAGACGKFFRWK
jgi:hypothetical protein